MEFKRKQFTKGFGGVSSASGTQNEVARPRTSFRKVTPGDHDRFMPKLEQLARQVRLRKQAARGEPDPPPGFKAHDVKFHDKFNARKALERKRRGLFN